METHFTMEQFYKFCSERKLMAAKCTQCGQLMVPPRPMCTSCHSTGLEWKELTPKGRIVTYTIIHVPPPQFADMAPYAVAIVDLQDNVRLPGMVRGVPLENLRTGLSVEVDFENQTKQEWPTWTRYFFRPPTTSV